MAYAVIDWIGQFGVMKILHSDQGRQFESVIIQEICQRFNIHKTCTTSLNPASDGQVERFNRTLIDMLSKYVGQNQRSWNDHLPMVLLSYHSSVHDSTALSPAMMTYAREVDLPVDLIFSSSESVSGQAADVTAYVANLSNQVEKVHHLAHNKLAQAAEKQKYIYDLKQFQNSYKVGDQVCLYSPIVKKGNCRKVNSKWTGPVSVNEVLSDIVIRIRLNGGTKNKVVHLNRLKPYLQ